MNWKLANGGKGFLAHQDHPAWSEFPPSMYYTAAIFGDDCTIENGCLQFATIESTILDYDPRNGELKQSFDWQHVTATSKDLLIFDSFIPHKSDDNLSQYDRRVFYFTFNKKDEGCYYHDYNKRKRMMMPPSIEINQRNEFNTKKQNGMDNESKKKIGMDNESKKQNILYNFANPIV